VTARPDPLIHPITRLSICGLLAAGADWVEFAALRDAAGISDSVLSKQSRLLEDAGYVEVRKGTPGPPPRHTLTGYTARIGCTLRPPAGAKYTRSRSAVRR
jgi:Winged helix DNA-binding domain